jgi:hypothetical protein
VHDEKKRTSRDYLDWHGYRLFVHISAAYGGLMFSKRANRNSMCQSAPVLHDKPIAKLLQLFRFVKNIAVNNAMSNLNTVR